MSGVIMPPSIPSISVGGRVFTDLANLKVLRAYITDATNCNATFRLETASAGYQVTTGKTLKILAGRILHAVTAGSAVKHPSILQSDNDVGLSATTAFTNAVYPGGNVQTGVVATNGGSVLPNQIEFMCNFDVAATKYVSMQNNGTTYYQIQLFCYEV